MGGLDLSSFKTYRVGKSEPVWMQVLDTTQCNVIKSLSFISDRKDLT